MGKISDLLAIFSILIPAIVGLFRLKKINVNYYPFIFLLFIALANETLQVIFTLHRYVAPAYCRSNIYILVEYVFYLWFFKKILVSPNLNWLRFLFVLGLIVWVYENFFLARLTNGYNYFFQVGYNFVLTLLSIEAINEVLLKERGNVLKNPLFLITAGMAIFFSFNIFVEIELHFATVEHKRFFKAIFEIQQWINCFVNLVFALAILWIPTKKNFTNPSF